MNRISHYLMWIGLIMVSVSVMGGIGYYYDCYPLTYLEKLNLVVLYYAGVGAFLASTLCELFKEQ